LQARAANFGTRLTAQHRSRGRELGGKEQVVGTRVHKRGTLLAVAALALASAPGSALAAGPGGTASPGTAQAPATSGPPARASLHVRNVRVAGVSCTPAAHCGTNPRQVSVHGTLLLQGPGLRAGMLVVFPSKPNAHVSARRSTPGAHLRSTSIGLVVTVPGNAHSGRIMVLVGGGRYTSAYGPISIVNHALHPPRPAAPVVSPSLVGATGPNPLEGQGMWIWYVSQSDGGRTAAIIAQAHAADVSTLFIKSSDGSSNYWSQFSPQLVSELHAAGLKVCAWQYVYGTNPAGEALLGAKAVAAGADCLVIDAEAEYEGRYAAAQTYIHELRAHVGPSYPIALASFPYVSYHESEPYSVFLGPGGAQYNAPQMYWKAIGTSVDTVYANTWIGNRIYGRPIYPLGQTYESVAPADLLRFREEAVDYGAGGWSFWDWQETNAAGWQALAAPLAPLTSVTPNGEYPELHKGSKGDQVLWLQEHLASAIPAQETTGTFGSQTLADLSAFQSSHGLPASGVATPQTWQALLALPVVEVNWTGGGPSGG
jgi:peptidoglycan hydrolase-like protein with peptidoglycan-binding domain